MTAKPVIARSNGVRGQYVGWNTAHDHKPLLSYALPHLEKLVCIMIYEAEHLKEQCSIKFSTNL